MVGFGRMADGHGVRPAPGTNRVSRPLEVRDPNIELVAARRRDNGERELALADQARNVGTRNALAARIFGDRYDLVWTAMLIGPAAKHDHAC